MIATHPIDANAIFLICCNLRRLNIELFVSVLYILEAAAMGVSHPMPLASMANALNTSPKEARGQVIYAFRVNENGNYCQ